LNNLLPPLCPYGVELTISNINVEITLSNSYDIYGGASLGGTYE